MMDRYQENPALTAMTRQTGCVKRSLDDGTALTDTLMMPMTALRKEVQTTPDGVRTARARGWRCGQP